MVTGERNLKNIQRIAELKHKLWLYKFKVFKNEKDRETIAAIKDEIERLKFDNRIMY